MRLRVPELLQKHKMTPYALHKASEGRISMSAAYRLAKGEFGEVSATVLDALCDVFEIRDPGPLLSREPMPEQTVATPKRRGRRPSAS